MSHGYRSCLSPTLALRFRGYESLIFHFLATPAEIGAKNGTLVLKDRIWTNGEAYVVQSEFSCKAGLTILLCASVSVDDPMRRYLLLLTLEPDPPL